MNESIPDALAANGTEDANEISLLRSVVSKPGSILNVSFPAPPVKISLSAPPVMMYHLQILLLCQLRPALIVSMPLPPVIMSLPASP